MQRQDELRKVGLSLEAARAAMIRAYKPATNPHEYTVRDLFQVSTCVLPLRSSSTQAAKLLPRIIGPFEVTEIVAAGPIRLKLPDTYVSTHDVFSVHDLHVRDLHAWAACPRASFAAGLSRSWCTSYPPSSRTGAGSQALRPCTS